MKIRVNHSFFMTIGLILLLVAGNYWGIAQFMMSFNMRLLFLILSGALPLLVPLYYKKSVFVIPWILCFLWVILNRNQEFANGGYYSTYRLIASYLFIFSSVKSYDWIKNAPKIIAAVGAANVVATLLFFVNNGLYQTFISMTYKSYQNGTQGGLYGYRAALAAHYSQNGSYITIVLLAVWAVYFCMKNTEKKKKLLLGFGIATCIALLLTSKRAHLLFGIATLIIVYYVVNPQKRVQRSFKLMLGAVVAIVLLNVLIDYIPEISQVFERFQTAGSDNASLARFLMWDRAFSIFSQNPLLGIGWYGFRYKSGLSEFTGATAGCHNIYLELLCEIGLIGFLIFIFVMGSSLILTLKNINQTYGIDDKTIEHIRWALAVSFAIQFFVLLYGFTGNPLYDDTFCFYSAAVAINVSFSTGMRGREEK